MTMIPTKKPLMCSDLLDGRVSEFDIVPRKVVYEFTISRMEALDAASGKNSEEAVAVFSDGSKALTRENGQKIAFERNGIALELKDALFSVSLPAVMVLVMLVGFHEFHWRGTRPAHVTDEGDSYAAWIDGRSFGTPLLKSLGGH